jgi:RNA polymerase sigma factor (TIGR02999 family)
MLEKRGGRLPPIEQLETNMNDSPDTNWLNELVPALYGELRQIARSHLRRERVSHPLQTTALVNEAYLRLIRGNSLSDASRTRCLSAAGLAMRHILVEEARSAGRLKRGGGWSRIQSDGVVADERNGATELLALAEALEDLASHDERKCLVVQMRFFAGMTNEEIADSLALTTRTVERDWQYARAWLFRRLSSGRGPARCDGNGN